MRLAAARLLAACCAALAAQPSQPSASAAVLESLARAFRDGDHEPLRLLASERARVQVELDGLPPVTGAYGAGQLAAVFARVFKAAATVSFEYLPEGQRASNASLFARARWRRRPSNDQREIEQAVTFVLALEDAGWRLVEIRASR